MATNELSLDAMIAKLVSIGAEAGKAHKNADNFSRQQLQDMAGHLKLPTSGSKPQLVDAIIAKSFYKEKAEQVDLSDDDSVDSVDPDDAITKFIKNKHTNFRLINLLMKQPAALQRSNLISTREQLQHREVGARNPLFVSVAGEFNDDTDSGGLAFQHEEFTKRKIDPEAPQKGFIRPKKCFKLWKDLLKRYAGAKSQVLPEYTPTRNIYTKSALYIDPYLTVPEIKPLFGRICCS